MNNIVEFEARASVERQAREWLIRMDGDQPLTESETRALREWMHRSVLHRQELQRICTFWSDANVLTELAVCLEPAPRQALEGRRRSVMALALAASAVLSAVILTWWSVRAGDGAVNGTYQTTVGQQKAITLSDRSSIQLNTDSQVEVNYGPHSRSIRLVRGEALFAAMPDPHRPFEVHAADGIVRAIGTAFVVRLEGTQVDVTVTTGAVDVSEAPAAATPSTVKGVAASRSLSRLGQLKAGEMTHFGRGSDHIEVQRLAEPQMQRRMAWREGYLVFAGEPLSEVIEQVNRYSVVTLEIGDPELASIAIGGRFKAGDLDAVLEVLQTNFGIAAHPVDDHRIRLESVRTR